MGSNRRSWTPGRGILFVVLAVGACGIVEETHQPHEPAPIGTGGTKNDPEEGAGGFAFPGPTTRDLPELDCDTRRYVCDAYDPPAGCRCDEERPVDWSECDEAHQYWCREYSPELSCVCDEGATSRCEAGVRRWLALGFASAACACDADVGMGGQGATSDARPPCVLPEGAWDIAPSELPWSPEPWVEPDLDSCPLPYLEPKSPQRFELMGLDACACRELGGEPVVAHFREGGGRYAGCSTALPVPALYRDAGWCIAPIEDAERVAYPPCALVFTDRAPAGWTFVSCDRCE